MCNKKNQIPNTKYKAFMLIEALTLLFIFSLITLTFYSVITVGVRYIQESKNRLIALSIANEKMEVVRNLKYADIKTSDVGGIIPKNSAVTSAGKIFDVDVEVGYVQDALDGDYPADAVPNDYKRVTVRVTWPGGFSANGVTLISRFVAPGLEMMNPGDGILSINIFSDQPGGVGIPGALVRIVNSEIGLDVTQTTDTEGNIILVGPYVKNSIQKYELTVTKSGYETVATMPKPYPDSTNPLYNPIDVHASVVTGSVNMANIVQNKLAKLKVETVDYLGQPLGGINFAISGGRVLGNKLVAPFEPVYGLNFEGQTGADGKKDFDSVSPGTYFFATEKIPDNYAIISTNPDMLPLTIPSDDEHILRVRLADKSVSALLVKVLKSDGTTAISGAEVHLTNASGYDETLSTTVDGRAFFPNNESLFSSGIYDLLVKAENFQESVTQVTVEDGQLKIEEIKLEVL